MYFLKKIINLFAFAIVFTMVLSCSQDSDQLNSKFIEMKLIAQRDGDYFVGDDCPDECWDGDLDKDCESPPTNCAVICGTRASNQYYTQFTNSVLNDTIISFYANGNGQNVIPLTMTAYSDIVNGNKKFYLITASSSPVKYGIW